VERLNSDIVAQGEGWRLAREEIAREPMLGALVELGPWRQQRFVESGGLVVGAQDELRVYGPGHRLELEAQQSVLYLPVGTAQPLVAWVLSIAKGQQPPDLPQVDHSAPASDPLTIPMVEPPPDTGLYPEWAQSWLRAPRDVATWASCLDVRATSLTQRTGRLAGASAKKLLAGVRATIAFELAAHYRGRGADLALDTGYSSHAHLSRDISARFGVPLTTLLSDEVSPELDWLQLLKSVVR
jgi:AraC-like DNA-binding protein